MRVSKYIEFRIKNSDLEGLEYNFECVHNIDEYSTDFVPTFRGALKSWNMTVQYWLAANIYKKVKASRQIR